LDESLSRAQKRADSGVQHLLLGGELDVETPALAELTAAANPTGTDSSLEFLNPD